MMQEEMKQRGYEEVGIAYGEDKMRFYVRFGDEIKLNSIISAKAKKEASELVDRMLEKRILEIAKKALNFN